MKISPQDALFVVDVQVDFCPGGALAVAEGDTIIPGINCAIEKFRHVIYTRDWHPANHCSFSPAPRFVDGSWPDHCVQNTPGAAFHRLLHVPPDAWIVSKGTEAAREAYSSFENINLIHDLREARITRVIVCGLATDYCVRATTIDARHAGFDVVVLEDLCRGVDIPAGSVAKAIDAMRNEGVTFCKSGEI